MGIFSAEPKRANSLQHALVVLGLVFAVQVGTSSVTLSSLGDLYRTFGEQFANVVGINAGVVPNEMNLLAQQFDDRKAELDEREQYIVERENALKSQYENVLLANGRATLLVLVSVIVFLVFLIILNFYLDWRRGLSAGIRGRPFSPVDHGHATPHEGEFQTRL